MVTYVGPIVGILWVFDVPVDDIVVGLALSARSDVVEGADTSACGLLFVDIILSFDVIYRMYGIRERAAPRGI
jgi:hypothetical protein